MGCGWLGLPLAERFVQLGYQVNGSTTSESKVPLLHEKEINPFLLNLQEVEADNEHLQEFLNTDVLILNIPPKLRADGGASYLKQMRLLLKAMCLSPVSRMLFVSSTSVYPNLNRVVTEEDIVFTEEQDPENTLLLAEKLFQDREDWMCTIVRFGGLVGGNRQPGRFMAGKKDLLDGDAPVNLIHLDDCINILQQIVQQEKWNKVYHACADEHPIRKDFYRTAAIAIGAEPPTFLDMEKTLFKLINSQHLKDDLAYVFKHPDPMAFF